MMQFSGDTIKKYWTLDSKEASAQIAFNYADRQRVQYKILRKIWVRSGLIIMVEAIAVKLYFGL